MTGQPWSIASRTIIPSTPESEAEAKTVKQVFAFVVTEEEDKLWMSYRQIKLLASS